MPTCAEFLVAVSAFSFLVASARAEESQAVSALATEVHARGWVVFPARSEKGDWDLFLMRPNGSRIRSLTPTPQWNEAWPRILAGRFAAPLSAVESRRDHLRQSLRLAGRARPCQQRWHEAAGTRGGG